MSLKLILKLVNKQEDNSFNESEGIYKRKQKFLF